MSIPRAGITVGGSRAGPPRYGTLLVALLLLLVISPFFHEHGFQHGIKDVLICLVMLSGVHAATGTARGLFLGLMFAAPVMVSHWAIGDRSGPWRYAIHYGLTIALLLFTTLTILRAILVDVRVTLATILGAISVYLLLGLSWAYGFAALDLAVPGSFNIEPGPMSLAAGKTLAREMFPQLVYFSFSTLTTSGYGDIVPLTPPARTLAYLEAVTGQMYLTVLVARLVGMHISQGPGPDRS